LVELTAAAAFVNPAAIVILSHQLGHLDQSISHIYPKKYTRLYLSPGVILRDLASLVSVAEKKPLSTVCSSSRLATAALSYYRFLWC